MNNSRSSSLTIARGFSTIDPKNIEHVLKSMIFCITQKLFAELIQFLFFIIANFYNYNKSIYFKDVFHDFLGDGIFNTDGESWKVQRKTASQIFHIKNFQTEFTR